MFRVFKVWYFGVRLKTRKNCADLIIYVCWMNFCTKKQNLNMHKYRTSEVQNSFWSLKHPLDSNHEDEMRRKNRSGKPFIGSHCIFAVRSGDKEDPKDVIRFLCHN